jgi:hypothetical protein
MSTTVRTSTLAALPSKLVALSTLADDFNEEHAAPDEAPLPEEPAAVQPTVRRRRRNAQELRVPNMPDTPAAAQSELLAGVPPTRYFSPSGVELVPAAAAAAASSADVLALGALLIDATRAKLSVPEYVDVMARQIDAWRRLQGLEG